MNDYEAKQAARKARLEARAEKLRRDSEAAFKRADSMASVIPFGQPILVGHHSEKRDRRYRGRIHAAMDKGCLLSTAAKRVEERAAAVGTGGISSDDPEAVKKLKQHLAECETLQKRMVQANALVRKQDRSGLAAMGFSESRIARLFIPDFCGRIGFADFELKNNGANVRRIKARIAELEAKAVKVAALAEPTTVEMPGYTVVNNLPENRVQVFFPGKPIDAVREVMKRAGFRWSPTNGCWQRHASDSALYLVLAGYVAAELDKLLPEAWKETP